MKRLSLLTLLFFSCLASNIQGQQFDWGIGFLSHSLDQPNSVDVYGDDKIVITVLFRDTIDVDPGPGLAQLIPDSNQTICNFVAMFDSSGNYIWHVGLMSQHVYCYPNCIDGDGNIYVSGVFRDSVTILPNNITLTGNCTFSFFMMKLDVNGNIIWTKVLTSPTTATGTISANLLLQKNTPTLAVYGYFTVPVDVDPGPGSTLVTPSSSRDILLGIYDTSGNFLSYKVISPQSGSLDPSEAVVDSSDNIIITCQFDGTVDIDPGPGVTNLTNSSFNSDVFVAKYDSNANFLWGWTIGSGSSDNIYAITVNQTGTIYISSRCGSTMDVNPGPAINNISAGRSFVAAYNSSGNFQWVWSDQVISGREAITDLYYVNNSLAMGMYVDGDINLGPFNVNSSWSTGGCGGFGSITTTGTPTSAFAFEGVVTADTFIASTIQQVCVGPNGELYVLGDFYGEQDFNVDTNNTFVMPWSHSLDSINVTPTDVFLLKYNYSALITEVPEIHPEASGFPNPANDKLYITSREKFCRIHFVNVSGQEIEAEFRLTDSGVEVNLITLASGWYTCIAVTEQSEQVVIPVLITR